MKIKKTISVVLTLFLLLLGTSVSAVEGEPVTEVSKQGDWAITELCIDQKGDGTWTNGYNNDMDIYEYIEICNTSGKVLNLYNYCLTYCSAYRTNERFERDITEITPFLTGNVWVDQPGNYFDGSTNSGQYKTYNMTTENAPKNPETCMVEPGGIVVIWLVGTESYYTLWNNGKGASMADFREFYGIDESVTVIAADGNAVAGAHGHDKNFNLKNNSIATYGIAYYSDELNRQANTTPGGANVYKTESYVKSTEMVSWVNVEYADNTIKNPEIAKATVANHSINFVTDIGGHSAKKWNQVFDMRRMALNEYLATPTPGSLTDLQKLYIIGNSLNPGDVLTLYGDTSYDADSVLVLPSDGSEQCLGWNINGTLYPIYSTLVVPEEGIQSVDLAYGTELVSPVPVKYIQFADLGDTYAVRFVATLDSLEYAKISCRITASMKNKEGKEVVKVFSGDITTVYTGITETDENGQTAVRSADSLGGNYLAAVSVRNISDAYGMIQLRVELSAVKTDGTVIHSAPAIVRTNAGSLVE